MNKTGLFTAMFLISVSVSANASLKSVCETTLEVQGNLAAAVHTRDPAYAQKAMEVGEPLAYTRGWYDRELSRLRLNPRDVEALRPLAHPDGSQAWRSVHDQFMETCMVMPKQYLSSYGDLVRLGMIDKADQQRAENPDFSNVEGMRAQGSPGAQSRLDAQAELFRKLDQEKAEAEARKKATGRPDWMTKN